MKLKSSISEIKEKSLDMLRGRWKTALILALFYTLFNGVVLGLETHFAESQYALIVVTVVTTFLEAFLDLGLRIGMLQYSRDTVPSVGCVFDAAKYYAKSLCYYVPVNALGFLVSNGTLYLSDHILQQGNVAMGYGLLFPVLGVLVGLSVLTAGLMPMLFLIIEQPRMKIRALYATSWKLMKGNKMKLLLLQVSFFGWMLLCMFTFGIGMLFLIPYMYVAECTFYNQLLEQQLPAVSEEPENMDSSEEQG